MEQARVVGTAGDIFAWVFGTIGDIGRGVEALTCCVRLCISFLGFGRLTSQ